MVKMCYILFAIEYGYSIYLSQIIEQAAFLLQYNVSVMENQEKGLILRIPIEDKDLLNTPNWNSEFSITKGNENGNFRIERDPKTNEGLIYLTKVNWYSQ